MITNFSIFEKQSWTNSLLIVDVQDCFSNFFTEKYLEKLIEHCELFSNVYQIIDVTDYPEQSYNFPNQIQVLEKEYGGEIPIEQASDCFSGEVLENYLTALDEYLNKGIEEGIYWKMNNGDYYFYIGGKDNNGIGHNWFICPEKLYNFFISIKNRNIELEVVGGAQYECLYDITTILDALDIKYKENSELIYSYKGSK